METVNETLALFKRQAELENAMKSAWRHPHHRGAGAPRHSQLTFQRMADFLE